MQFLGPWEVALILVIALIIFGPSKLPQLARSLGEAVREFRRASSEFEKPFKPETSKNIQSGEKPHNKNEEKGS